MSVYLLWGLRKLEKEKMLCFSFLRDVLNKNANLVHGVMNQHITSAYLQNWEWPIRGHGGNLFLRPTCERGCNHAVLWKEQLGYDLRAFLGDFGSSLILQHGSDESLSFIGTQFSYQSTQTINSDTSNIPPNSHKVFIKDRGPFPQRLELNLPQWQYCLLSYTRHLFILCWRAQSKTRHSAGETELIDATVPVLAERGDTAPFKAPLNTFFLHQRARRAPLQTVCARGLRQHHIYVSVINFISFISWQKPEWFLRWMALSPAWPSWHYSAGSLLL